MDTAIPKGVTLNESVSLRMGQAQRHLEGLLKRGMHERELVDTVVKVCGSYQLPYKCFDMLEKWALRTYILEA